AGSFGDSLFHVSARTVLGLPLFFNVGMIEGIAVASDWPDHFNKALTPHQSVKAMQLMGMKVPVDKLFSTGFMSFSAARGYTIAGSYLRFLLDRYGIARLQKLYQSGGDFRAIYGRTLAELSAQWQEVIENTELPEGAEEVVRERFRRPALFSRPCPHAVARSQVEIAEKLAEGSPEQAVSLAREVCADVPGEPRHLLSLATLLVHSGQHGEAAEIYQSIGMNEENISSSLRARALFELVRLHIAEGKRSEAEALLRLIVDMPLSDNLLRQGQVMLRVLTHPGPAARPLQEIFWNRDPAKSVDRLVVVGLASEAAAAEPKLGLAHYLLGRQLRGRGNPDATRRAFLRALSGELSPLVEREAARLLAESSYLAGRFQDVERACAILTRSTQPEVARLLGYDWLERIHWKTHGQVPDKPLGWRLGQTQ
ncbi:MAG: CDC27 family protein, partial [Kofleriaceae bacterium]|nr:CDC27 family protein [Kofleriaceae bacterium]